MRLATGFTLCAGDVVASPSEELSLSDVPLPLAAKFSPLSPRQNPPSAAKFYRLKSLLLAGARRRFAAHAGQGSGESSRLLHKSRAH